MKFTKTILGAATLSVALVTLPGVVFAADTTQAKTPDAAETQEESKSFMHEHRESAAKEAAEKKRMAAHHAKSVKHVAAQGDKMKGKN